jgi:hypothetical protein
LGIVVHTCNLSIQEAETEELRVQGQSELYSETMSQKKKNTEVLRNMVQDQTMTSMDGTVTKK